MEPGRLVRVGGLGTLLGPEGSHKSSDTVFGLGLGTRSFGAGSGVGSGVGWFSQGPPSLKPDLVVGWGCWWVWCLVVEQWTRASSSAHVGPVWIGVGVWEANVEQ